MKLTEGNSNAISTTLMKCLNSEGNRILVKADGPEQGAFSGLFVSDPDWQISRDEGNTWNENTEWLNVLANARITWQIKMHATDHTDHLQMWLSTRTPGGAEHDGFIDLFDWDNKKFQLRLNDQVWGRPVVFTQIYY